ncbi:MAG: S8 family peptidase, partial [Holosporales bacterium]|nr:S8 family peptidase [Holosporales bacterium]
MWLFTRRCVIAELFLLLVGCGGEGGDDSTGSAGSTEKTYDPPVPDGIEADALTTRYYTDLAGIAAAHKKEITGKSITIAICEEGPYHKAEMDAQMPSRWGLGSGYPMPDPTKKSQTGSSKHSFLVSQCANIVAPEAHFLLFNSKQPAVFQHIKKNKLATVINESMYIPQTDDKGAKKPDTYPNSSSSTFSAEYAGALGSDSVIAFISAGNDDGYPSCNRVALTTGNIIPLYKYNSVVWNVFFVGEYYPGSPNTLQGCHPEEGEEDTRFFVADGRTDGAHGTSFSCPKVAGIAALLQDKWEYFKAHCNALGRLMVETADLVPVEYEPKYDADGKAIASPKKVTGKFRRPNLQKALNFDEKTATLCGIPWSETAVHSSAAFGDAFRRCGLQQALWVDPYGRSWSGVTDAEADVSRCVVLAQESSFQSVAEWFS